MMTNMAVALIALAIVVGEQLGKPFDETLMGIFICWTPQSVAGILCLIVALCYKAQARTNPG